MIEIGVLIFVLLVIIAIYLIFKILKHLIINSVLGILALFISNLIFPYLGIAPVFYTWVVIAICAIGGLLGAVLIIALHITGIAF